MDKIDFDNEIKIIKQIAKNNDYKIEHINKLIKKHINKKNNSYKLIRKNKYIGSLYTTKLPNILQNTLKKYNYNVGFRTNNKLIKHLRSKNNNTKNNLEKAGVYKIACETCDKIYIGQTGRTFTKRFDDHTPKINNTSSRQQLEKINTKYGLHLIDNNHDYTDDKINNLHKNLTPLHYCNKGNYLDTLEEYKIHKNTKIDGNNLTNDKLLYKNNILFDKILNNQKL